MIKFPCKCGFEFDVSDEMAGNPLQCPRCMLLNEVPLLSDLNDLEKDGTIRLEPVAIEEEGKREAELRRTYLPRRHDDAGNDIDMRNTFEQIVAAGAEDVPLELKDHVRPGTPKYDPVTGELIKPLTVRGDEAKPVIPITAGPPTLHYEKNYVSPALAIWKAPMLLFTPGSAAVLLIMFALHLVALGGWVVIGGGLFFAGFVPLFVYTLTIAHLANIVQETGPEEKDELPTPLRGVSWYDDVLMPYWYFMFSFALTYWPAFMVVLSRAMWLKAGPALTIEISGALALIGTFFFPAVLLTTATSGTYINLRPDRILGVIGAIGGRYILIVILWIGAALVYVIGMRETIASAANLVALFGTLPVSMPFGLSLALLAFGLYLLHMFSWVLGGLYRSCHRDFPWAFQRHISTRKVERRKVRHGKPIPLEAKDAGMLAPQPPPPKLRVKPVRE
jgi:hypothetical protein